MTIVPLKKMTLYGAESRKAAVIDRLHELGFAHLCQLGELEEEYDADEGDELREALKYLSSCSEKRRQTRRKDEFDRNAIVAETLQVASDEQSRSDEGDELRVAIEATEPWGEFAMPPTREVGGVRFWFYLVPLREVSQLADLELAYQVVNQDLRYAFVVVLSPNEPQPEEMIGARVKLDARPLSELRLRLEVVEEELEELRHRRVGLTRWCDLLKGALDEADDAAAQRQAVKRTVDAKRVFALQAWIPEPKIETAMAFAKEYGLAITLAEPHADEQPPTLLHNPEYRAGSEGLVTFYKTPDYRSWDPSLVAYASFAIFFAMIVADAGYGLVLLLLTGYLWKRMGKTAAARRSRNVLLTVVLATVAYGVLCGSYFGVTPAEDSILGRLQIIDATSQALMMPFTIIVGVLHLSIANVVVAWSQRGRTTALAPLGWVIVMAAATLAGIGAFAPINENVAGNLTRFGSYGLVIGLLMVFLFSSPRPIFSPSLKDQAMRVVEGLQGLTGFSGLFGDVLSYLRLFALGLSSAKLSETFNELGGQAWDNAGWGVIAAIGIVLLGHTLNLLLSIMSGVVHGLRLNCIEFFKWSLPEEGFLFKAFAKKARRP